MTTDEERTPVADERSTRGGFLAWLRQVLYPEDFRIPPPPSAAHVHAADEVDAMRARVDELQHRLDEQEAAATEAGPDSSDDAALVDAAMGLWRLRQRLAKLDGDATTRGLRRSLTTASDGLEKLGVVVLEHDRQPYDSGLQVEALDFQPEPGLLRETIIETVQPSIFRYDRRIQQGQVVVGRPEGGEHS